MLRRSSQAWRSLSIPVLYELDADLEKIAVEVLPDAFGWPSFSAPHGILEEDHCDQPTRGGSWLVTNTLVGQDWQNHLLQRARRSSAGCCRRTASGSGGLQDCSRGCSGKAAVVRASAEQAWRMPEGLGHPFMDGQFMTLHSSRWEGMFGEWRTAPTNQPLWLIGQTNKPFW